MIICTSLNSVTQRRNILFVPENVSFEFWQALLTLT